jgi:hypothetical protein
MVNRISFQGKETMHKTLLGFFGLTLVGLTIGCHHTAGVCDCEQIPPPGGLCPSAAGVTGDGGLGHYPVKAEAIKELPKNTKEPAKAAEND